MDRSRVFDPIRGLGNSPFIADGPQLDRAGGFAFLAPMPLGAVEALAHSAVVTNENFFSHANLVSKAPRAICQASFPRCSLGGKPDVAKNSRFSRRKSLPVSPRFLQCPSN